MTLRNQSVAKLATIPEPMKDYRDANGFVFLDVPVSEADASWVELTPEQRASVRPMTAVDHRQWDAWHSRELEDPDGAVAE